MGQVAMTVLSLQEAVERTGTSKVDIWRAIQAGTLSAQKTDYGGFAIDPADLFVVFETKQPDQCSTAEDAAPCVEAPDSPGRSTTPETAATTDVLATFAALGTEPKGPLELPAQALAGDELRQNREEKRAVDLAERSAQPPSRVLSGRESKRWPNMLCWRMNVVSPGGCGSSNGSRCAVAEQPGSGCEKGCRDDRRRVAQLWSQGSYGGGGKKLSFVLPSR